MNDEIPKDTIITIEDENVELTYSLCDYICYFIQIFIICGLIYILMLSLYFLYRIIEIIIIKQ